MCSGAGASVNWPAVAAAGKRSDIAASAVTAGVFNRTERTNCGHRWSSGGGEVVLGAGPDEAEERM
jgi:hypothetical protein